MRVLYFLTICCICSCNPFSNQKSVGDYKVIAVLDGDSIVVLDSLDQKDTVRIFGIDCPERGMDYSRKARNFTKDKLWKNKVSLKQIERDYYHRSVAEVFYFENDTVLLNFSEEILKEGLAWHYTRYSNRKKFAKAEQLAKDKKVNIWSMEHPVPPWEWRRLN